MPSISHHPPFSHPLLYPPIPSPPSPACPTCHPSLPPSLLPPFLFFYPSSLHLFTPLFPHHHPQLSFTLSVHPSPIPPTSIKYPCAGAASGGDWWGLGKGDAARMAASAPSQSTMVTATRQTIRTTARCASRAGRSSCATPARGPTTWSAWTPSWRRPPRASGAVLTV